MEQAPRILCSWGPTPRPPAGLRRPVLALEAPRPGESLLSGRAATWAAPVQGRAAGPQATELASLDPRRQPGRVTSLGLEQK